MLIRAENGPVSDSAAYQTLSKSFLSEGTTVLGSSHSNTKKECEAEWRKVAYATWKADLTPSCWTGSQSHCSVRSPRMNPLFLRLLRCLIFPVRPYQTLCNWVAPKGGGLFFWEGAAMVKWEGAGSVWHWYVVRAWCCLNGEWFEISVHVKAALPRGFQFLIRRGYPEHPPL